MKKENLINIFDTAKETGQDIAVEVTIPGQTTTEVIINRNENLDNKLEFYKKAYDEDCVHCMNKDVKIVDAYCVNFFKMYDSQSGELFNSSDEIEEDR